MNLLSRIITLLAAVCIAQVNLFAQSISFTHGPGEEIEAEYFNPVLAPFYHGVASGDPLQDRVIIWTRVTPENDTIVSVSWVMAKDTSFSVIVASGELSTDYTKDYTVKVDVTDLEPNVTYYYYFTALNQNSIVGRTHTLPGANASHLRFAVGSCSNYQMGYFNSYKRIAEQNDLDAVLHLGDYIYEYPTYDYGYTVEVGREHRPNHEIISLDDYRIRHNFYKLDQDLMAAHQQQPFICVWDDHEIANNTYEYGAQNHTEETEGDFITRKESAIHAYLEWMPIRAPQYIGGSPKIYRSFEMGNLADVIMLDTRVEERDKQAVSATDPLLADSTREILGSVQREWFFDKIDASNATWKIYGNQVMMSEQGVNDVDIDAWTGYPFERKKVVDKLIATGDKNHILLTGDTHRSWSFDLSEDPFDPEYYQPFTGMGTFGVELAAPSLASPNRNEGSPGTSPEPFQDALLYANPHLRYSDLDNHGFFILDITNLKVQADYHFVDTKFRSERDSIGDGWFTLKDQGYLQAAVTPATGKPEQAIPAPEGPRPSVDEVLGITAPQPMSNMFISGVYPNPTSDYITIGLSLNESEFVQMRLIDFNGKVCYEHGMQVLPGNQKITVDLPQNLAVGIYTMVFTTDAQSKPMSKLVSIVK